MSSLIMNKKLYLIYLFVVASCCLVQEIHAVKFVVTNTVANTPGGQMFDKEIGVNYALEIMPNITRTIFQVFRQRSLNDRKRVPVLNVYISEFEGFAYARGSDINISASALDIYFYPREKSKWFFYSLMVHEMSHVFQWNANYGAPGRLIEGTADYVMVKSGFYNPNQYAKPGEGKSWDEGYDKTERFLEYCDSLLWGFTAKLNRKMRDTYSDAYWVELLGKPVDQLWSEYKAKYGNLP